MEARIGRRCTSGVTAFAIFYLLSPDLPRLAPRRGKAEDVRLVSVAVPVPFLDALTYTIPEHLPVPAVGARVLVEVGSRIRTGCVVGPSGQRRARCTRRRRRPGT